MFQWNRRLEIYVVLKTNKTEKGDNLSQYREIINVTKTFYFTKLNPKSI